MTERQVGDDLVTDERGLVQRGLIIRLLILPNGLAGLRETLEWIRASLSPLVTLSVMSQYYPANKVSEERFPMLNRRISPRRTRPRSSVTSSWPVWRYISAIAARACPT